MTTTTIQAQDVTSFIEAMNRPNMNITSITPVDGTLRVSQRYQFFIVELGELVWNEEIATITVVNGTPGVDQVARETLDTFASALGVLWDDVAVVAFIEGTVTVSLNRTITTPEA